jgi:chromosome segregation protein
LYLKSLELQGFKSFPDKTKLTFEAGATVIVGPNGSGKSNIADAMRWVLGEISSKNIRGSKMEDIIFGGADSRKPMGYAEVSVTFDNRDEFSRLDCPYDEVMVTRRYYRSGDSEYYINRQPVRLRDIYEMFMNTGVGRDGYSIIGQGKIAEIISRKSDERRSIFEDASGIAKYRHKKTETERRLADTEDNMTRVGDVFAEVAAQVGPLEKEAEKAARAIELLETKKRVDVQLWLYDTDKLRTELAEAEDLYNRSSFDLKTINDTIESYEAQNEKLFDISQNNKMESEQLLSEITRQTERNHALDSEYRVAENNMRHTEETVRTAKENIVNYENALAAEKEAKAQKNEHIEHLKLTLEQLKKEHTDAIAEQARLRGEADKLLSLCEESLSDLRVFEKDATDIRVRLSVIENAKNTDGDKNSAILDEIKKYDELAESFGKQIAACEKTLKEYEDAIAGLDSQITASADKRNELYETRKTGEEQLSAARLERDSLSQRIETIRAMEQQLEGYSHSVRHVMKAYAEGKIRTASGAPCGKIYGPLSKVIAVGDEYVTAIETALAANLQHIVVEDEQTAKAAMYDLKRAEAGRATFFPISSMRGQSATHEMEQARKYKGFVSFADKLVSCEDKFREIVSSLLGRTVVFDNIENATEMAKSLSYRVQVVTLDGQQIRVGGSFTGGSTKSGGMLSRASEIKQLEGKFAKANKTLSECIERQKETEQQIAEIEEQSSSLEDKRRLYEVMKTGETSRADQLRAKLDANQTLAEKLRADYGDVIEQNRRYEQEAQTLLAKEKELSVRISEITELREQKDVERHGLLETCDELSRKITELYIKVSETGKDIETEETFIASIGERMTAYAENIREQNARIEECEARIATFDSEQKTNRQLFAEGEAVLSELGRKRARLESDSFAFEKKLSDMNTKIREKRNEQENIFREHTKNENKLTALKADQDKLATRLWDEYEMTRAEAVALGYPPITKVTRAATAAKQIDCRNKLRAIGNVDLDAVNKYKEVKERYDRMDRQIKDLEASKNDLLKIIDRLETEMKSAFTDSFNRINENFGQTFSELFGGGTAEIVLTEPENVLTSGIEIKAAPPGKIIKSLMQLSGGEQSFVAIALLFAILKVNPPPFCIMDEIEAALDEVNVARLAEYIKRYADSTQFVMITHRRGTMEAANMLYGVTMPEHGISKVLALDVAEISKKKGDDWDGIFG